LTQFVELDEEDGQPGADNQDSRGHPDGQPARGGHWGSLHGDRFKRLQPAQRISPNHSQP
jgi:hypothetical protein